MQQVILPFQIKCKFHTSIKPFNSHEWLRHSFSLQYQYNINQKRDMNKEKYQFGDPIPSSLNQYHKNCVIDSKENYKSDLGVKGLKNIGPYDYIMFWCLYLSLTNATYE